MESIHVTVRQTSRGYLTMQPTNGVLLKPDGNDSTISCFDTRDRLFLRPPISITVPSKSDLWYRIREANILGLCVTSRAFLSNPEG